MHIAFCINDNYAKYITVCIKSICVNNADDVVIHVITDGISEKNWQRIKKAADGHDNVSVIKHVVDDTCLRGLKDTWSIYTWYRVLLPTLLPLDVHRVLYLDADTVVDGDLSPLFSIDMADKAIGCAIDIESFNPETFRRCGYEAQKRYVCAGVMLMNLDYWREHDLSQRIIRWGFEHNDVIKFPDQDTINVLCQDNKIVLPMKYGMQNVFRESTEMQQFATELREKPVIIHFAGCAPWIKEFDNTHYHPIWMRYSRMLAQPVMPQYITKGINKYKVMIHRLLHDRRP